MPEGATPGRGDPGCHPPAGGASEPTALEKPDRRNPNQVKPGEKNKNKTNPRKHPRGPPSRHPRNTVSLQCFTRKGGAGGVPKGTGTCRMICNKQGTGGRDKTKQAKTTKLPWKAFRHRQETHMELSRRDPEGYVLPVRRAHIRALQSSGRIREKGSWKTYRTALSIPDMEAKVAPGKLIHALKFHNQLLCNLVLRFISLVWFVGSWFMVV